MRNAYYRRHSEAENRFYRFIDSKLPFRTFALAAGAIFIMLVMFAFACLAAATYISASSDFASIKNNGDRCAAYYSSETAAVDILISLSADNGSSFTDDSGEIRYDYRDHVLTISRNDNIFYFDVPVNRKKSLHVTAHVTGGQIDITKWYIKDRDLIP